MSKSTIYHILVILILLFLPQAGMSQQNTDIKKPTRTRVTDKDKNTKNNTANKNKDTKQEAKNNQTTGKTTDKNAEKPAAKASSAQNKKSDNTAPKSDDKKTAAAAAAASTVKQDPNKPNANKQDANKQEANKPVAGKVEKDTAAKAPAPAPKPRRVPVDPDKVQFDGIDISKHQGVIDWVELKKNTKIKFVYIKATEGSNYIDPRYKQNIANARKHGFKVGSYHYFTDLSGARTQFKNFITTVKREEQDLIPVIDVEKRDRWTPQQLRDSVKVFADLLEDYYGCKPIIYTFETFFNRNLGKAFERYPIFIAKYPKGQEQPNINGIKWILWQFSESGKFKGVKDNLVYMSRFNKNCGLGDITYNPGKHKPKNPSVYDAVDHKDKPATVNMTEQKPKEAPKQSKKQQEEAKKQAEKEKKAKERNRKLAEDEAKKNAEAEKKAKEKAEQQKRQKARQEAHDAEVKREAEAKAKRKADAQKAREQKAKQNASSKKSNKSASLMNSSTSSKLSQSQRNDSIRAAKQKGRKINKSSADND